MKKFKYKGFPKTPKLIFHKILFLGLGKTLKLFWKYFECGNSQYIFAKDVTLFWLFWQLKNSITYMFLVQLYLTQDICSLGSLQTFGLVHCAKNKWESGHKKLEHRVWAALFVSLFSKACFLLHLAQLQFKSKL